MNLHPGDTSEPFRVKVYLQTITAWVEVAGWERERGKGGGGRVYCVSTTL